MMNRTDQELGELLSPLGQAALAYASKGWAVFPCQMRGKKPLTQHGLKEATTDRERIREWWTRWPDANIGHPTEALVVLDVDGSDGESSLATLEKQHGPPGKTLTARTGKGRHLYFLPNGLSIHNSAGKLGRGLDVRAQGGYVILPPSVHENDTRYEWTVKTNPAPLPEWIVEVFTEPERSQTGHGGATRIIPKGKRNESLASLAGSMRRRGMTPEAIAEGLVKENALRCYPPLPEDEVRKIAQSYGRYSPGRSQANGASVYSAVPGVLASDVKPERVRWLWDDHIPLGKLTIFDGDPGVAKSTATIDLAARVTGSWGMPDGSEANTTPSGVVIVSLEDGIADTIVPRLIAAGADLTKLRIIQTINGLDGIPRTPTLPVDLPAIEAAIRDMSAALVLIDPLVATLAEKTNSHQDQDVRRTLAPCTALADKTGVALILVRHLNKGNNPNPKYRGGGSIGIIGAARASFIFAEDPDEEGSFIMAANKMNLCAKPPSLKYTLQEQDGALLVAWEGTSSHTARSILAQPESAEETNACANAKAFLSEVLAAGPLESKFIYREARQAGIARRTLERAKAQLGVKSAKCGMDAGWKWQLPKIGTPPRRLPIMTTWRSSEKRLKQSIMFQHLRRRSPIVKTWQPSGRVMATLASH
jgi:hypothetical protein